MPFELFERADLEFYEIQPEQLSLPLLRQRYRQTALRLHPDKRTGSEELLKAASAIYERLKLGLDRFFLLQRLGKVSTLRSCVKGAASSSVSSFTAELQPQAIA